MPRLSERTKDLKKLIKSVPRDDDGFCVSFDVDDQDEWAPFMSEYGFVVIRILSQQECSQTISEFFDEANSRPRPDATPRSVPLSLTDPTSWESENWPTGRSRFLVDFPAVSPQALRNRTHPRLYQFFSALLRRRELFASIDAWGVMRGTRIVDVNAPSGYVEHPEWRQNLTPHWDVNPWTYVQETTCEHLPPVYQGVLALVDCDDSTGGFSVAPGSARSLAVWTEAVPAQKSERPNHFDVDSSDPWRPLVQHVPIRAGEAVVWDSGSLHANYPNSGERMRLVQYVRCTTDEYLSDPVRGAHLPWVTARKYNLDLTAVAGVANLDKQQMQMLGLVPW
jgi:hypothetical protein